MRNLAPNISLLLLVVAGFALADGDPRGIDIAIGAGLGALTFGALALIEPR